MKKYILYATILCIGFIGINSCKKITQNDLASSAFNFSPIANGEEYAIVSFKGDNAKNVIIPSSYQGKPVTSITANVFNYEKLLTARLSIVIVTDTIDGEAIPRKDTVNKYLITTFKMESIEIPTSIKNIGTGAFNMPSLKELRCFNTTPPNLATEAIVTQQPLAIYVPTESSAAYEAQWTPDKIKYPAEKTSTTANINFRTIPN